MNPQNGKGSAPRKGANDRKFKDNYDKIFGKKSKDENDATHQCD